MIIHEIEWFNEFECIGGECPQTCCKGWLIPLDEEDLIRYSEEKGMLGVSLFISTAAYTRSRINLCSGECRFHTKEGLCRLQLIKGHDFIPWACRSFPRFYRNYGEFEERYLDLSCIASAKLFVKNADKIRLSEKEGTPETKSCTTNDDTAYLNTLLDIRRDMTEAVMKAFSKDTRIQESNGPVPGPDMKGIEQAGRLADSLYKYACSLQDTYAKGGADAAVPLFTEFSGSLGASDQGSRTDKNCCFPLPPKVLTEFAEAILYHFGQKRTGAELHRLLKDAQAFIERYGRNTADFDKKTKELFAGNPSLLMLLYEYLTYYLYQYFLEAYETYSFRRIVSLGIIHANMLLLLLLTISESRPEGTGKASVSADDIAYIIAVYTRKAYYNETIQDDLYRIFESSRPDD